MQFRTEVKVPPHDRPITYGDSLLFMGSCFVENVGGRLRDLKFNALVNPFGVLFNPESIRLSLLRMLEGREFSESDLFEREGVWNSFSLHSGFASLSAGAFLQKANLALRQGRVALLKADFLFLTWGTAWVYRHADGGVVANCHKQPASLFVRERLEVEQVVASYAALFSRLWAENDKLRVVLTVSPIRHWKDGAHGNQLSKSLLLLAADELVGRFPGRVSYFPSYELMMDDLRDYRFYASDMLHPGEQAIRYLWEKFAEALLADEARQTAAEVGRLLQAAAHRPFNPDSLPHRRFVESTLAQMEVVEARCPYVDFSEARLLLAGEKGTTV